MMQITEITAGDCGIFRLKFLQVRHHLTAKYFNFKNSDTNYQVNISLRIHQIKMRIVSSCWNSEFTGKLAQGKPEKILGIMMLCIFIYNRLCQKSLKLWFNVIYELNHLVVSYEDSSVTTKSSL